MPHAFPDAHAVVLAPVGRDAELAMRLLRELSIKAMPAKDLIGLSNALSDNILFVVVTEEVLRSADLRALSRWLNAQPSWSDLPFILLTRQGGGPERNPAAARFSETLGHVSFIERPFHPTTFFSIARTVLKARLRQYERRSTLEELGESGERLRIALLAGRLGAWQLDTATHTLTCSDACKAVFGRSPDSDFTYDDLLASVHPDDRARMRDAVRQSVSTGEDYAIEYRVIWPDASVHWADIRARLVSIGGMMQLVGVSSDITLRKSAEAELRMHNEELEQRVAGRTAALQEAHRKTLEEMTQRVAAEEKLRQSQKLEMIGQLTGGIAHDFNNLLMAVLGNLELLKKYLHHDAKALHLVDGAFQGARRGASLTQRLLAFARRQELQIQAVDVSALVEGMADLFERTIGHSIELDIEPSDRPAIAKIDANQVELALLNLVVNARDAMPSGGHLKISVGHAERGTNGGTASFVQLRVSDSGQGMDSVTLEKATEPFFSTKGVGKGTGLGLSMVHGLAKQLGGEFRIESQLGLGTTAELLLPAGEAPAPRPVETDVSLAAPAAPMRALSILLVDDDALIAMSSVDMLEDLGHDVTEALSGEQALSQLRSGQHFDLLITDFAMPKMNGAQLARLVRDLRPTLPILLATGFAELPSGDESGLLRLGKPYTQAQLSASIDQAMLRAVGT